MTISSIGTSYYTTTSGAVQASPPAKGGSPDFADIFNKLDQDASGTQT